jgi:hypothetical protein
MAALKAGYERVYTVLDYDDGPRKGVADFQGQPHLYECVFDDSEGDYSKFFLLMPLDAESLRMALEAWAIWQRWEFAYHRGETDISTHPALPHESQRHRELEGVLRNLLVMDSAKAVTRIGHFEAVGGETLPKGILRTLQVKWVEASAE